jgi:integrase
LIGLHCTGVTVQQPCSDRGHVVRVRLTEAFLDTLKPTERDQYWFDSLLGTFAYRLTPQGRGIFVVGKPRRTVGHRPELKVADARELAGEMLSDIRSGRDPALERKARQQAAQAGAMTVNELADKWMAEYVEVKLKRRTRADYERLLRLHIRPALGQLPVARVDFDAVNRMHVSMKRIPREANYTLRTTSGLMRFASNLKLRTDNPCKGIALYPEGRSERFLSAAEIGRAADAIDQAEQKGRIGPHGAAGIRLALFTGARSGEITAIEWPHIDWQRKIVRLPDSKINEPRTIHLSDAALEVLKTIPRVGRFVIAGDLENEPYKNLGRAWIVVRQFAGLEDVRLHDLRHSYASLAASQGVSLQMIGKLLGHKVPATTARYAHLARDAVADINNQLGAAMTAAIENRPAGGAVVKLRRRRRGA